MDNLSKALETVKLDQIFSSPQVVILMGLPGSGKSYVADYLNQKYGFTVLSGENISHALFGDNQPDFVLVYKIIRRLALQLLNKGHSIVIDGTNLKFSFRQQIYTEVCKNIKPILIYLLVDDQTARIRLDSREANKNDKQNIKSNCSTETFEKFKKQIDEPLAKEFCYRLVSNENLLKKIDNVIKPSNSVYN